MSANIRPAENPIGRKFYSVREFRDQFRFSHSYTYDLIAGKKLINGQRLESRMVNGKRLIVAESADRLLLSATDEMSSIGAAARKARARKREGAPLAEQPVPAKQSGHAKS